MKNIIIAGVPRSGKSTIAKKIANLLQINYFPFDSIVSTMGTLFPQHGITHYENSEIVSKKLTPFLKEFLKNLNYEGINYIIDVYQIYPIDLLSIIKSREYIVLYIGYTQIEVEKKIEIIRQYSSSEDWTESICNSDLYNIINGYIKESKDILLQCIEKNIRFIDTGLDFKLAIEEALKYIQINVNE